MTEILIILGLYFYAVPHRGKKHGTLFKVHTKVGESRMWILVLNLKGGNGYAALQWFVSKTVLKDQNPFDAFHTLKC